MSARMSLQVNKDSFTLSPGDEAQVQVTLTNEADIVDSFSLSVVGLDSAWYTFPSPGPAKLFPEQSSEVELRLHPPKEGGALAGEYPLSIVATSQENLMNVRRLD